MFLNLKSLKDFIKCNLTITSTCCFWPPVPPIIKKRKKKKKENDFKG